MFPLLPFSWDKMGNIFFTLQASGHGQRSPSHNGLNGPERKGRIGKKRQSKSQLIGRLFSVPIYSLRKEWRRPWREVCQMWCFWGQSAMRTFASIWVFRRSSCHWRAWSPEWDRILHQGDRMIPQPMNRGSKPHWSGETWCREKVVLKKKIFCY